MAVHLVLRDHYTPSGKQVASFDDATVLDWFRRHWEIFRDVPDGQGGDRLVELLGFGVYGLPSIFRAAIEEGLALPETDEQLGGYLEKHLYAEGVALYEPHLLTVLTDDDELEMAYYVFDDVYLARNRGFAEFLLLEDWRLPGGQREDLPFCPEVPIAPSQYPEGTGQGTTYLTMQAYQDTLCLTDMGGDNTTLGGVRIPELARYLTRAGLDWCYLDLFRSQLLSAPFTADPVEEAFRQAVLGDPDDEASWRAWSDWLAENGQRPLGVLLLEQALRGVARLPVKELPDSLCLGLGSAPLTEAQERIGRVLSSGTIQSRHDPAKSCIQVEEHVLVLCLHYDYWYGDTDVYHQWIFFDDLWAAAHPDLANSLLRYDRHWDCLAPGGPRE